MEKRSDKSINLEIERINKTTGNHRLKEFVLNLFRDKKFLKKVVEIRQRLGLLKTGYFSFANPDGPFEKPDSVYNLMPKILAGVDNLCLEYHLGTMWIGMIENYSR